MDRLNIIASIVSNELCVDFSLLMGNEEFSELVYKVKNLSINEATEKLINKANEII